MPFKTEKHHDTSFSKNDVVQHYKGGVYKILDFAIHTETEEVLVLYQKVTPFTTSVTEGNVWARPLSMFDQEISVNGERIQRFKILKV